MWPWRGVFFFCVWWLWCIGKCAKCFELIQKEPSARTRVLSLFTCESFSFSVELHVVFCFLSLCRCTSISYNKCSYFSGEGLRERKRVGYIRLWHGDESGVSDYFVPLSGVSCCKFWGRTDRSMGARGAGATPRVRYPARLGGRGIRRVRDGMLFLEGCTLTRRERGSWRGGLRSCVLSLFFAFSSSGLYSEEFTSMHCRSFGAFCVYR